MEIDKNPYNFLEIIALLTGFSHSTGDVSKLDNPTLSQAWASYD